MKEKFKAKHHRPQQDDSRWWLAIKSFKKLNSKGAKFINRELSWLSFNERVLQEAADPNVPVFERLRFLGIFSNNLDEFFRVRVATIKRILRYGKQKEPTKELLGSSPKTILSQIQKIASDQHVHFDRIYNQILEELKKKYKIHKLNERTLNEEQGEFVKIYFQEKIRSALTPIMLSPESRFPKLLDKTIYFAIKLSSHHTGEVKYALMEIPTSIVPRFLVLPESRGNKFFILLDDVIRYNLKDIFYIFDFDRIEAYTIKVTLDAELDIDNDVSKSFIELISKSLKKRELANPVRLIYDQNIPTDLFSFIIENLQLTEEENIIAGARYHNFKDFMHFPDFGIMEGKYPRLPHLRHRHLLPSVSMFSQIAQRDILLYYPYHSFHHFNDLLREAAIDPKVKSIKITLYRVAEESTVVKALINALKNGKEVTAVVELQARFDEQTNIYWANKLAEEGAKVIYGVKGLKVHAKLCLITRKEGKKTLDYANIGTGNYNEETAKLYTDHSLFTSDPRITREVAALFEFFDNNLEIGKYKHLLVSPFNMRKRLNKLIQHEIKNAQSGKPAYIWLKLNNLVDPDMIKKLYQAAKAGVKIKIIVRSICSLIPQKKGLSENITAKSIVDRFLEHSRFYIFCNGGEEKYYISSADWMTRNLDHRSEVACPIYDPELQAEIKDIFNLQWADNVKARYLDEKQLNQYVRNKRNPLRSQMEIYNYYNSKK
ncbi:MAG: polyphosphate kinase [Chitinophagales bacterium]|nr:MAG: polyphosphate kinase [Chitinophagales bacterium]